jgi:long-chain acyl-CoA synthetase
VPGPAADPGRPAASRRGPQARAPRRSPPAEPTSAPAPVDAGPPVPEESYRRRPWLSSYPPSVPPGVDVPAVPLPGLLDDAAGRRPDSVALAFLGAEITYGELRRQVDAVAGALAGLGVGRGDRVALVLPDCPQFVVSWFAALRLGAVVAPHDPLTPAPELGRRLGESGATVAICHDRAYASLAAARNRTALRHVVVTSLADYLPRRARLALRLPIARARRVRADLTAALPEGELVRRFVDLVRQRGRAVGQVELDPARDVALLAWTDEGSARAVVLTHRALAANASQVRAWLAPAAAGPPVPPVVVAGLPLWHPHGLTTCLTATVMGGGTLVLLPDADPRAVLAAVADHRPTVLPGGPTLFAELVEAPDVDRYDLPSVQVAVCVGRGLPQQAQERFERLGGGRLVEAHGLVETGLTHAQPVQGPRRPGTVGLPLPGTRAVVLDRADPACAVPVTAVGELAVTGPQLFAGYWRRPDQTRAAATADGHHRTGLVAAMREDGAFTLLDSVPSVRPPTEPVPAGRREGARPPSPPGPVPPAPPDPAPGREGGDATTQQ